MFLSIQGWWFKGASMVGQRTWYYALPPRTLVSSMTAHMILVLRIAVRRLFRVSCGHGKKEVLGLTSLQPLQGAAWHSTSS